MKFYSCSFTSKAVSYIGSDANHTAYDFVCVKDQLVLFLMSSMSFSSFSLACFINRIFRIFNMNTKIDYVVQM